MQYVPVHFGLNLNPLSANVGYIHMRVTPRTGKIIKMASVFLKEEIVLQS